MKINVVNSDEFYDKINKHDYDGFCWEEDAFAIRGLKFDKENKLHSRLSYLAYQTSHSAGYGECAATLTTLVSDLYDVIPAQLWGEKYTEYELPSKIKRDREKVLDELVQQAQELDMGY